MLRVSFALNNSVFFPLNKFLCNWLIVDIPFFGNILKFLFIYFFIYWDLFWNNFHAEIGKHIIQEKFNICLLFYYCT